MSTTTLTCVGCNVEFPFTDEEQSFFAEKGFTPPKRCKPCRDQAKQQRQGGDRRPSGYSSNSGGYGHSGPRPERTFHEATCSKCGILTQVPFKPNGSKPVYCRDCFTPAPY